MACNVKFERRLQTEASDDESESDQETETQVQVKDLQLGSRGTEDTSKDQCPKSTKLRETQGQRPERSLPPSHPLPMRQREAVRPTVEGISAEEHLKNLMLIYESELPLTIFFENANEFRKYSRAVHLAATNDVKQKRRIEIKSSLSEIQSKLESALGDLLLAAKRMRLSMASLSSRLEQYNDVVSFFLSLNRAGRC